MLATPLDVVEDQGEIDEWFDIKTGVKQGYNMSGFLFLIVIILIG